ncbi:MAG: response regulator [Cyanobacteria bacterium P01_E01_bin.6]
MNTQNSGFILIVDDNPDNLEILEQTLKREGYAVRTAADGIDALEQVGEELPDLILLDVMMPHLDGFETCSRLKTHEKTSKVPIIFMTALADTESKIHGLSLGAVDYITKPFSRGEVLARVKTQWSLQHLMRTLNHQNDQLQKEIGKRQYVEAELRQFNEQLEQGVLIHDAELQQEQIKLMQQEKLAVLEALASGVVNATKPPIVDITKHIGLAQQYYQQLLEHISLYQQQTPAPSEGISKHANDIHLNDISQNIQTIVESIKESCNSISAVNTSLETFAQYTHDQRREMNVHEVLDHALLLLKHRFQAQSNRSEIELIKLYEDLPMVMGSPCQINQAVTNILANALDAFDQQSLENPTIIIRTEQQDHKILLHIADNAGGISTDLQPNIFDPTYTTKKLGKRTGFGLPIVHYIVVDSHGGDLSFISTPGDGTEFTIELPLSTPS